MDTFCKPGFIARYYWLCGVSLLFSFCIQRTTLAQSNAPASPKDSAGLAPLSPVQLPGKGLGQYDFFYAGEGKVHHMYIIRQGRIDWSYTNLNSKGEISDAVLLANGNILFAHQFGVSLLTPDKQIRWHYDAPPGCEIHTAMPIGKSHVVFINGNPARLVVMNMASNKTVKEFTLPVGNPSGVHGQFRHARLTGKGTIMVAHMDMGKICEYDSNGKVLLSLEVPRPWSAVPQKNGNILLCSGSLVREINRQGKTIWEVTPNDLAEYHLTSPQLATRLPNGNVLVNNWFNQWNGSVDLTNPPVQAVEITPEKKVSWALRSWEEPVNLGPSTIIQLLENTGQLERLSFGNIR